MVAAFPESRVVEMWQNCLPGRTDLVTEDGGPVRIVYPGRLNDDRGADLCDAVIATGRGLLKGDVEVHVKSSSWWGHHHHQNYIFNRVILHVVYWHDVAAPVTLENGRRVPTLALARYVEETGGQESGVATDARSAMPCRASGERRTEGFIGGILDAAGDRRFMSRVAGFHEALCQEEAGQVIYRGIMGALGYTRNKLPMMELARRMPLARLETAAAGILSPEECLLRFQALLIGTAGLLPSQQSGRYSKDALADEWVDRLEETWAAYAEVTAMYPCDWLSFKVRPGNLPRRRIAAMSCLLCRYHEEGLLPALVRELEAKADRGLEERLLISAEGYWGRHIDFGLPARRPVPALLGKDRAEAIVINVVLPFAFAWGEVLARPRIAARALELYRHYPAAAENTLERHMRRQLGISRCPVNSARRQQGIIHIYKTLCSQGKCGDCPLG